jgi:hypothetical protein
MLVEGEEVLVLLGVNGNTSHKLVVMVVMDLASSITGSSVTRAGGGGGGSYGIWF